MNTKMKGLVGIVTLFAFLLSITTANAQSKRIKASGTYETKNIKIGNFDKIKLLGSPTVVYTQSDGERPTLKIYGSDNVIELVDCKISDRTLVVSFKSGTSIEFGKQGRLKIMASSPTLKDVHLQGSGDVVLENKVKCDNLSLNLQGSGDISADEVICTGDLSVNLQGSGDISVKSRVRAGDVALNLMGSGDIDIYNLTARAAAATLQGSGDLKVKGVNEIGDVIVSLLGSGDLNFTGIKGENVKAELNGSGDIKVAGTAQQAILMLRNSGDLDAKELKSVDVNATVNGSGSISCNVSGTLKCNITGSGDISYKGEPANVHSTGRNKPRKL
ncbi:GIN domain-containing protein [Bacteroides sp.]